MIPTGPFAQLTAAVAAFPEAVERVLGLAPGSLELIDEPSLHFWFDTPADREGYP